MDLHPPLIDVASRLAAACERAGVEYALIGGMAAGAYGSDVPTTDVDACVAIAPQDSAAVERFLVAIRDLEFRVNVDALKRRAETGHGIFFLWLGRVRLDVMLQKGDEYWSDALRNRRKASVHGREMWVASPEDIIALKLAASREKDIEAVRQVARIQYRRLDLPRLRANAQRLAWKVPELPARVEAVIEYAAEIDRLASLPPSDEAS